MKFILKYFTFVDVVGVVQNMKPVRVLQTILGERLFFRFQLFDGRLDSLHILLQQYVVPHLFNHFVPNIMYAVMWSML